MEILNQSVKKAGDAIAAAPLARVSTAEPSKDAVGGIVDQDNRLTWLTHDESGGPTPYAKQKLGLPTIETETATGGFLDKDNRLTWLTHDESGGPTPYALDRLQKSLALPTGSPSTPTTPTGAPTNRHAMLENELRLLHGGTIRTAGAAPVCMIFDHGLYNFKNIVLPLLRARGLASTLAINSRMYAAGAANTFENRETTFAEIDAWTVADKVEIANHGATHRAGTLTEAEAQDDIVNGLKELQAALPSKRILTWVQPAIEYPGFNNGATTANWTDTESGKLIYQHHAAATGTMRAVNQPQIPRDGNIVQGAYGVWLDAASSVATIKTQITAAATAHRGIILRHHPKSIDGGSTLITTAELTDLLDFLKAEQDAGHIRVLTFGQWSIADTGY
ncbi:polysaccharide deacetylase family protein [Arthrobacter burdickii]|uniref:Polysaccharide deacetylase family protein n=1 Tax=Arthrobacter burdickii TaxID=3035920 RepID=A0ABT8K3M6_9MICC|nr:polysaccharide deacetylase family protein [Arthrobacter burdickii]MDN4611959.1 polysaccharide deacetylase family protein [Arthrobacter burdickii]